MFELPIVEVLFGWSLLVHGLLARLFRVALEREGLHLQIVAKAFLPVGVVLIFLKQLLRSFVLLDVDPARWTS